MPPLQGWSGWCPPSKTTLLVLTVLMQRPAYKSKAPKHDAFSCRFVLVGQPNHLDASIPHPSPGFCRWLPGFVSRGFLVRCDTGRLEKTGGSRIPHSGCFDHPWGLLNHWKETNLRRNSGRSFQDSTIHWRPETRAATIIKNTQSNAKQT